MYSRRCICGKRTTVYGVCDLLLLVESDEIRLVGENDELCAITGIEFHHRVADMYFGYRWTNHESFGDFIVGKTASHHLPSIRDSRS